MKVNDTRHINKVVNRRDLKQGEVYFDEDGFYVLLTDEDSVVELQSGRIFELLDHYGESSEFIPVNAVLEIRS